MNLYYEQYKYIPTPPDIVKITWGEGHHKPEQERGERLNQDKGKMIEGKMEEGQTDKEMEQFL